MNGKKRRVIEEATLKESKGSTMRLEGVNDMHPDLQTAHTESVTAVKGVSASRCKNMKTGFTGFSTM